MGLKYKRLKISMPSASFDTLCKNSMYTYTCIDHYFINCQPVSPSLVLTNSGSLSSIFLDWTCVVGCSKTSCVLIPCTGLAYTVSVWGTKGAIFNLFLGNLDFLFIGLFVAVPSFTLTLPR